MSFACKYCTKSFVKESTLAAHLCEPKRRFQQQHETGVHQCRRSCGSLGHPWLPQRMETSQHACRSVVRALGAIVDRSHVLTPLPAQVSSRLDARRGNHCDGQLHHHSGHRLLGWLRLLPLLGTGAWARSAWPPRQPSRELLDSPSTHPPAALAIRKALLIMRDRKSTRLNSSHTDISRMPSSA